MIMPNLDLKSVSSTSNALGRFRHLRDPVPPFYLGTSSWMVSLQFHLEKSQTPTRVDHLLIKYLLQGPIKVTVTRIEQCPKEMLGRNVHTVYGMIKQTRDKVGPRFSGYLESKEPLDDLLEVIRMSFI